MSLRRTISCLLFPLTCWYAVGVRCRDMLFALGIKKQEVPHITTIGVGNLSTGGTGKTPHVEYLLRLLADRYPTALLSRGYKRQTKGFLLDDGSHDPRLLGDEPAMLAQKFPAVQVAVCEKRVEGVRRLMEQHRLEEGPDGNEVRISTAPQLIVLDDVFQHRYIKPTVNILLTEYSRPFSRDHILPYGDLREFRSARIRANIVIVTKSPAKLNPIERHNIVKELRLQNCQQVFFSYFDYLPLRALDGQEAAVDLRRVDHVLVVTGIAHPEPLVAELRQHTRVHHLAFADHHAFSPRDLSQIKAAYDALPGSNKIIVTTEKDAARLGTRLQGLPAYVQPIRVAFHKSPDMDFDQIVESAVKENISFLSKLSVWNR